MAPRARLLDRVGRICERAVGDDRSLRLELLAALRDGVGFDAHAWLLTDPVTEVGAAPLAEVPSLSDLPRLIRSKYLTSVNRWTTLPGPVATLQQATRGQPETSLVWRALLERYDVTDVASLVFRDRFGCWAFLDLWRRGGAFDEAEVAFLAEVAVPVTTSLRRCQARTFTEGGAGSTSEPASKGPAVLMLTPDLDVRGQTPETEAYLQALLPAEADRRPVPAAAYNVAAQLLAVEAGIDDRPPFARVHLGEGLWLTLKAARVGTGATPVDDIAVTIEAATPVERLEVFARAHGLTIREEEVLRHLLTGVSTRELAERLVVSENTAHDHLKSIFGKTGAHGGRSLVARVTGR